MDFLTNLFDYTPSGNAQDHILHEFILAFAIIWISSLVGLFFGWLMWRGCKKRCSEIEAENAIIRAKQTTRI